MRWFASLEMVVKCLGSILAVVEQFSYFSWILVNHWLLHGSSVIENIVKENTKNINQNLKDLFFKGLAVAPMELMHS